MNDTTTTTTTTTEPKLITRKEYLDRSREPGVFRAYYAQFVGDFERAEVSRVIGLERIAKSDDEHLNDIPLYLWDRCCVSFTMASKMREAGDYRTKAGTVCIAKEAARQLLCLKGPVSA